MRRAPKVPYIAKSLIYVFPLLRDLRSLKVDRTVLRGQKCLQRGQNDGILNRAKQDGTRVGSSAVYV